MNKYRRKEIALVKLELENIGDQVCAVSDQIECLQDEEQEYFDNMPEGPQSGEKGQRAEEVIASIDEAKTSMEEIIEFLTSAQGLLEEAAE